MTSTVTAAHRSHAAVTTAAPLRSAPRHAARRCSAAAAVPGRSPRSPRWSRPARRADPLAADPLHALAGAERRRTGSAPTSSAGTCFDPGRARRPALADASASAADAARRRPSARCWAARRARPPGSPTRCSAAASTCWPPSPSCCSRCCSSRSPGRGTGSADRRDRRRHAAALRPGGPRPRPSSVRRAGYVEQAVTFGAVPAAAGAAARPAQRARPAAGARHDRARQRHHRRLGAELPRHGTAAAVARVGRDALRGPQLPARRLVGGDPARASRVTADRRSR